MEQTRGNLSKTFFMLVGMFMFAEAANQVNLDGHLESYMIDEMGNTVSISLAVYTGKTLSGGEQDLDYYIIEDKGKGSELLKYAGYGAVIKGTVRILPDGKKILRVNSYEIEVVDEDEEILDMQGE